MSVLSDTYKRFYVGPTSFWDLPAETNVMELRAAVEQGIKDGVHLQVQVVVEEVLVEAAINCQRLQTWAVVEVPIVPGGVIDTAPPL
jgi:hypothetical protein